MIEIKNYKNVSSGNNTPSKMMIDSPKKGPNFFV